jgi:hypothetical protein
MDIKIRINNNDGIALLTVLLITIILSLLAMVAISTTGDDVMNAGGNTAAQYTFNVANSGMNMVISQIGTGTGTNAGPGCAGLPLSGWYYYSTSGNNNCNASAASPVFNASVSINPYFFGLLNFPVPANDSHYVKPFGFEYSGVYGPVPGYSYPFYKATMNSLTQNNTSHVIQAGMTFEYGPIINPGYP